MRNRAKAIARAIDRTGFEQDQANPFSGSSLVPMLIIGLALTFAGMIAAVALS
ncbi:hypothetical protein WDM22_28890 [Bradyrhizobium septentrionale]|uniref:hypothetical protein n=1 Tax=Bradyrhizobium septentrionale TaxID=1404411 RepID=UPI001596B92D|nr:hypothetical protein [Bradyrhizobium septentrionale]UGY15888.1 hypothetical protein HAP48_0046610 [Bradyrhizobium septentrionale]UGY24463.1 hypothetical protein HU675_0042250 [Bradyrhizobium septentrionale]